MTIVYVLLAVAAAFGLYKYRAKLGIGSEVSSLVSKGSAFARVAEQEGKLIALQTTAKVKKEAALAVHNALDEVDKLLG
jgi:hypothetical protein